MRIGPILAVLVLLSGAEAARADAVRGQMVFRDQCGLCHRAGPGDGEGGQGPSLAGVVGRKAASDPAFSYTPALGKAGLAWSREALDKYLADPLAMVSGTSMATNVPDAKDRRDLIDYLEGVRK